jgi:hypothetical protein
MTDDALLQWLVEYKHKGGGLQRLIALGRLFGAAAPDDGEVGAIGPRSYLSN